MDRDVVIEDQIKKYLKYAKKTKEHGDVLEQYIVNQRALDLAHAREAELREKKPMLPSSTHSTSAHRAQPRPCPAAPSGTQRQGAQTKPRMLNTRSKE
eukprot:6033948-Heterocapsa_arctica.AAC.1